MPAVKSYQANRKQVSRKWAKKTFDLIFWIPICVISFKLTLFLFCFTFLVYLECYSNENDKINPSQFQDLIIIKSHWELCIWTCQIVSFTVDDSCTYNDFVLSSRVGVVVVVASNWSTMADITLLCTIQVSDGSYCFCLGLCFSLLFFFSLLLHCDSNVNLTMNHYHRITLITEARQVSDLCF